MQPDMSQPGPEVWPRLWGPLWGYLGQSRTLQGRAGDRLAAGSSRIVTAFPLSHAVWRWVVEHGNSALCRRDRWSLPLRRPAICAVF